MRIQLAIAAFLSGITLFAQEEGGHRIVAGPSFLEPLQKRDSVLVLDQFRYGMELKDIAEGTPIALPVFDKESTARDGHLAIIQDWQLDSVKVSSRRDSVARYNIRASFTLAPLIPGEFELFELQCLVGQDTLVFNNQMMQVTEPSIDLETFQPNDIHPQAKFPYTLTELFPWVYGIAMSGLLIAALILWLVNRKKKAAEEKANAEPAHIRALRKLDGFRGDKFWKADQQKAFYSGVTDTLREYIVARYGVGALEMTTAEIFDGLKGSDIPADLYQEMKDLFERADFVKFAKFTATDEENAKVLPQAVRFVTETYQQEILSAPEGPRNDNNTSVIPSEASVSHSRGSVIPSEASVSQKKEG